MDSVFKICKKGACSITITGLERDNDEYLNETGEITVSTRNYAYSQTITLNAITSIKSSGDEVTQKYDIVEHVIDCIDESELEMPIDGLYEVTHIILPTDVWLKYVLERDPTTLTAYNSVYYYDTQSESFMKYVDEESIAVTVEEILEVNAIPPATITEKTTTIIRGDKNTFCVCHINECFYRLCKNLLGDLPGRCKNRTDDVKMLIYNRDIIWMAINVIKYLIELGQYYEAQRVLEDITQCGGICKDVMVDKNTIGGGSCGCNN